MSAAKYLFKRYGIFIYRPTYCTTAAAAAAAAIIRDVAFATRY